METIQLLQFECDQCGLQIGRPVQLIRPEAFIKGHNRTMLTQFWCSRCRAPQAYRIKFGRDKDRNIIASIKDRIDPDSLLIPRANPTGITIRPKQKSYKR